MRNILLSAVLLSTASFASASTDPLGGRANVMECSHDEVLAYMELPDPERAATRDYHAWEAAFQSTEMVAAEDDPENCLGVLYGDMSALGDEVQAGIASLMSLSMPDLSAAMSSLTDELTKSICSRAQSAVDTASEAVMQGVDTARRQATREVIRRYGQKAMDAYIEDAIFSPEFQSMGLGYRNGQIEKDAFRRKVKRRWASELEELQDAAVDTAVDGL